MDDYKEADALWLEVEQPLEDRFTAEEKRQFVEATLQPGTNISLVRHVLSPSILFRWRKLAEEGSLSAVHADESVVPISEVQALQQQVDQLQRLLGKKTAECEILREVVEVGRAKEKLLLHSP